MIILVTGASGHIGSNLVRLLCARNETVRVLVHDTSKSLEGLDVEKVHGDVRDLESVRRATQGVDIVYHLAAKIALTHADHALMHAVNVIGTRNVVQSCLQAGVRRLVHFSSIHALHDQPSHALLDETRVLANGRHLSAYDRTKVEGELEVQAGIAAGLDTVIINPTGVIGPHDYGPSHMGQLMLNMYHCRLLSLVNGGFDWVDVEDVAAGAISAAKHGRCGERYLLSGRAHTLREIAQTITDVTGKRTPALTSPLSLAHIGIPFAYLFSKISRRPQLLTRASLYALQSHRHISSAKATRELNYYPRSLRETIERTFGWYASAGLL